MRDRELEDRWWVDWLPALAGRCNHSFSSLLANTQDKLTRLQWLDRLMLDILVMEHDASVLGPSGGRSGELGVPKKDECR